MPQIENGRQREGSDEFTVWYDEAGFCASGRRGCSGKRGNEIDFAGTAVISLRLDIERGAERE